MSWKIEIKPTAEKKYRKLAKNTRNQLKTALLELERSEKPLSHPNVRMLVGKLHGDYRYRVGRWRLLFTPDLENCILNVYAILPRGKAY